MLQESNLKKKIVIQEEKTGGSPFPLLYIAITGGFLI
jgi:hypothetical protein